MERQRLPDFLIIGGQKCGTTWIWKQLRDHSEVRVPPRKEIHFFDKRIMNHDLQWYANEVKDKTNLNRIIGEKTPCYAHLDRKTIEFVKLVLPKAKIVLVLRDPVKRAWSQARMEVGAYNTRQVTKKHLFRLVFNVGTFRNLKRGDYQSILENWRYYFPDHQIKVLFYEDLKRDPKYFYRHLCEFLGVKLEYSEASLLKKEWVSSGVDCPAAVATLLRSKYRRTYEYVEREFPHYSNPWNTPQAAPLSLFQLIACFVQINVVTAPYNVVYRVYDMIKRLRRAKRVDVLSRGLSLVDQPGADSYI